MTAALTPEAEQSVSNIAARYGLSTDKCIGNGKNKVANRWYSQLFKKRIQL